MKRMALLWISIAMFCLAPPANAGQPLTLLVHPYLSVREIHKRFGPLAAFLGNATGKTVRVKVSKDYNQHIADVGSDQMDLAYIGPAEYVAMTAKHGGKPLLACQEVDGQTTLRGMIVVKADAPFTTLAQLAGKRVAFVDVNSTMGYLLPQRMLEQAEVSIDRLARADFLGTHSNVALAVLSGDYEAGAVKSETFASYQARGLKTLAELPSVHEHLLVASTRLPDSLIAKLRESLHSLHDPSVLKAIHPGLTALAPVKDSDYDNLRQLLQDKAH